MYPQLLPGFSSYGIFLALAHIVGVASVLRLVQKRGFALEPFVNLIFLIIFSGLLGARAAYVLEHWNAEFRGQEWKIWRLWEGGLSFHGGFFLAFPSYLAFLRRSRLPILAVSDIVAPVLPLCMGIIRLGCFCVGCCYGFPTTLPWGVGAQHLHPTQLYEASALFVLSALLFARSRRNPWPSGVLATLSIMAYAGLRFGLDFLRADMEHTFFALSLSQLAAGIIFLTGAALLFFLLRKRN